MHPRQRRALLLHRTGCRARIDPIRFVAKRAATISGRNWNRWGVGCTSFQHPRPASALCPTCRTRPSLLPQSEVDIDIEAELGIELPKSDDEAEESEDEEEEDEEEQPAAQADAQQQAEQAAAAKALQQQMSKKASTGGAGAWQRCCWVLGLLWCVPARQAPHGAHEGTRQGVYLPAA